jgi:hypothetical protein
MLVSTGAPARGIGTIELISHKVGEPLTAANNVSSSSPFLSGNGRYVVYASTATDITGPTFTDGNMGGGADTYLYDRVLNANTLVSNSTVGATVSGNGTTTPIAISDDGAYILLRSLATDLMTYTDTNGSGADLFMWDRVADTMSLVSHASSSQTVSGAAPLGASTGFDMTPSGSHVAFGSDSDDLVAGFTDANTTGDDAYLWDRSSGNITLVSHASGNPTTGGASGTAFGAPQLSDNGALIAYASAATDLDIFDPNGVNDVFVFDATTGTNRLISRHNSQVSSADAASQQPAISGNGAVVAYQSKATNLIAGFNDGTINGFDIFYCKGNPCTTKLASRKAGTTKTSGNLPSTFVHTGAKGGAITFFSKATDLIKGFVDTNGTLNTDTQNADIYTFKLKRARMSLVSRKVGTTKVGAAGEPFLSGVSRDEQFVLYTSNANDLIAGFQDQNGVGIHDAYMFDRALGRNRLISHENGDNDAGADGSVGSPLISADSTTLAFISVGENHVGAMTDAGTFFDVFVVQRN